MMRLDEYLTNACAIGNRLTGSAGLRPATYGYDSVPRSEATTRPGAKRTGPYNRVSLTTSLGTTRYTMDPHGSILPRVLIRANPDNTKTYYIYGIGLTHQITTNVEGAQSTTNRGGIK